ncbi:MAG: hypothetical protein O7J95_12405 [Planctomycetota bacterium]|nr:hypothetical protein [Planctomycetota bacterium]
MESVAEGIPSDAVIFGHWRSRPRQGLADRYLRHLRDALHGSGAFSELVRILEERMKEDEKRDFALVARYWKKILEEIGWWRLFSREVAFAVRRGPAIAPGDGGRWEWIFLFHVGEKSRDETLLAMRRVLFGLGAVFPQYGILAKDRDGVPTTVLYDLDEEEQICAGGHGAVVALATSDQFLRESLKLLGGKGRGIAFVHSERYFELREKRGAAAAAHSVEPGGQPAPSRLELIYQPADTLRGNAALDVVEVFHLEARFQNDRIDWNLRYKLRESDDNLLARALSSQGGVADLLRRVPRSAVAFTAESGAQPEVLYDYLLDLIGALSGGPFLPDALERQQSELEFNVKDSVLRLLSGRRLSIVFSAEDGAAPEKSGDSRVYFLELKRQAGQNARNEARTRLAELVRRIKEAGLAVETREVEGGGDEGKGDFFYVPTRAILGWPLLLGVTSTDVVVATSEEALGRALRAAAGDGESIAGNPAFADLWKLPEGRLSAVRYGSLAADLASLRGGLRLLGGLAKFVPGGGGAGVLKPLLRVLPRFQEAVRSLAFLERRVSYSLRDGSSHSGRGTIFLKRRD